MWSWALGGFSVGTILTLGYITSGASLFFRHHSWSDVAFYPGFLVSYHGFDLMGYNASVSLSCLAVGLAYFVLALAIALVLRKARFAR